MAAFSGVGTAWSSRFVETRMHLGGPEKWIWVGRRLGELDFGNPNANSIPRDDWSASVHSRQ